MKKISYIIFSLLLVIVVLLVSMFITIIVQENQEPEYSNQILYSSDLHEYNDYELNVKIRDTREIGASDRRSVWAVFVDIKDKNSGIERELMLFSGDCSSTDKINYDVKWETDYYSISINNNSDFNMVYYFDYKDIVELYNNRIYSSNS
ncbi:MAG: hypothetical protein ACI4JW_01625 [Oscillospiraceae bacterium]